MANSRSALKRVRKTEAETVRNRTVNSRVKTFRKKVDAAIESGDAKAAQAALGEFASAADKAGRKNIIHKNTANRMKGSLTRRIQAMS
jgi:small subunit ribosomal protein S20